MTKDTKNYLYHLAVFTGGTLPIITILLDPSSRWSIISAAIGILCLFPLRDAYLDKHMPDWRKK